MERIGSQAEPIPVGQGTYWHWKSACGAEMWLQVNSENECVGVTPCYSGDARIRVRVTSRISRPDDSPLEGAIHGWADPGNDSEGGAYPFVFDVADYARHVALNFPSVVEAQIAAFAHDVSIHASVAAYDQIESDGPRFASQSFIPSGLFSSDGNSTPPGSMAILTGHVVATATKINALTGSSYYWAEVASLGGSFDVVIDPALCDEAPKTGGVISGSFWLCGRILTA